MLLEASEYKRRKRILRNGSWISLVKRPARFSRTMSSEATKKARTWVMKWHASSLRVVLDKWPQLS